MAKYAKLTRGLCELVDDFGLVSFTTLNVQARGGAGLHEIAHSCEEITRGLCESAARQPRL